MRKHLKLTEQNIANVERRMGLSRNSSIETSNCNRIFNEFQEEFRQKFIIVPALKNASEFEIDEIDPVNGTKYEYVTEYDRRTCKEDDLPEFVKKTWRDEGKNHRHEKGKAVRDMQSAQRIFYGTYDELYLNAICDIAIRSQSQFQLLVVYALQDLLF